MKDNFTHVCFIIDESGSMHGSEGDILGGYKKIIEEQKANTTGECAISLYTFANNVYNPCFFKDVKEVSANLKYRPGGGTALNDAVGTAIDAIGETLAAMPEDLRPSSNLIVIMTDGEENASHKYTLGEVREKIKHQTEKYNWTFMYLGADITTSKIADDYGVKYRGFSSKAHLGDNYCMLNSVISSVRGMNADVASAALDDAVFEYATALNASYSTEKGITLSAVADDSVVNEIKA